VVPSVRLRGRELIRPLGGTFSHWVRVVVGVVAVVGEVVVIAGRVVAVVSGFLILAGSRVAEFFIARRLLLPGWGGWW
jgi:hypothetical protein